MNIKILIRQIIASGKAYLTVHNGDLSVVPVIHEKIHHGDNGVKDTTLNAPLFQFLHKLRINEADGTHIIIEKANLNPFLSLFAKNFLDFSKGLSILYGMIFHENKLPRLGQGFQLCLQAQRSFLIKYKLRVAIHRKLSASLQISKLISHGFVLLFQLIRNQMRLIQIREEHGIRRFDSLPHGFCKS